MFKLATFLSKHCKQKQHLSEAVEAFKDSDPGFPDRFKDVELDQAMESVLGDPSLQQDEAESRSQKPGGPGR